MTLRKRAWMWLAGVGVAVGLVLAAGTSGAGERNKPRPKFGDFNPDDETVEMFAAMESGEIEVKIIPADSTKARVLIDNKTDKPLNVRLPEAFAAVPVLAQFGGGGQGGFGGGGQGGGGNQGGGGGFGGGGGGQQGGGGGGFFNVPPEKVGQIRVPFVCLEHGKDDPRPAIPYKIIPMAEFNSDPAVYELCALLGQGRCDQRVAQAAAWNLASQMSWDELAGKQIRRLNGVTYPYFSRQEIATAMALANVAVEQGKTRQVEESPGARTASVQP